jgi:hypothetical protein
MTLHILDDSITSDQTGHTARRIAPDKHGWEVSWLPGQVMSRNSAITAMLLADLTGPGDVDAKHNLWPHIEGWAAELGLTARDVTARTAGPPGRTSPGKSPLPADPEAAG